MPKDTTALPWKPKDGDPTWLGGDRWKIRVYAGLGPDGKQRQKSSTFRAPGIEEARKIARRNRVEIEASLKTAAQYKGTVKELAEEWMAARKPTHATTTAYANKIMVKRIVEELGSIRLEKLSPRDLDRFYMKLMAPGARRPREYKGQPVKVKNPRKDGLSASSANHYHRLIHAMLRQAHRWGMVPGNVADLATPPKKVDGQNHNMPTPAALRALVAGAGHNLQVAIAIASATGCRRGEIVGLTWGDIDGRRLHVRRALVHVPGTNGKLEIKLPKSGKPRSMSIDEDLLGILLDHRMWLAGECHKIGGTLNADGPILATLRADRKGKADPNGGEPYTPAWLTQAWTDLCAPANVTFRFHDLRHFHASQLIDQDIALTKVQKRLGHAQLSTTLNIYTHQLQESDEDAALAIGAAIKS